MEMRVAPREIKTKKPRISQISQIEIIWPCQRQPRIPLIKLQKVSGYRGAPNDAGIACILEGERNTPLMIMPQKISVIREIRGVFVFWPAFNCIRCGISGGSGLLFCYHIRLFLRLGFEY